MWEAGRMEDSDNGTCIFLSEFAFKCTLSGMQLFQNVSI